MVRAKFKVNSLTHTSGVKVRLGEDGKPVKDVKGYDVYDPSPMVTIKMSPVYGNGDPNHENTKFWQSSPSGTLELNCVNEAASVQFKLDQEFYLDFTPA